MALGAISVGHAAGLDQHAAHWGDDDHSALTRHDRCARTEQHTTEGKVEIWGDDASSEI